MEHQIPVNDMPQEQPKSGQAVHDEIPEPLREVGQKVSDAFNEFKESETWEKMLDARDKARDYITENPVNSFFYALGAGVFLGFLLKRK
ncbi:hypothetical protein BIU88_02130 [Chlorobaculum limnaeum]|uniref:DUF883 domain-containing protein n=1 Tax=Chlorobaculum limnaeum TaxID=274537 RepID=A0A1D8D0U7_CHLLM|nr:hypothetical protein [Chlorobaculum limnaeum]AOS83045.1 hypothetical protein BIU88_02130 [Chlorobaculum limnaeum]